MTLSGADYFLIDSSNGVFLGADTAVVVPEVFGGYGYDISYDPDAAIEYAEQQGIVLDPPGTPGLQLTALKLEERPYLVIDTETGISAAPEDLRLLPAPADADELLDLLPGEVISRAKAEGLVPVVSEAVRDAEGLPFESTVG